MIYYNTENIEKILESFVCVS